MLAGEALGIAGRILRDAHNAGLLSAVVGEDAFDVGERELTHRAADLEESSDHRPALAGLGQRESRAIAVQRKRKFRGLYADSQRSHASPPGTAILIDASMPERLRAVAYA